MNNIKIAILSTVATLLVVLLVASTKTVETINLRSIIEPLPQVVKAPIKKKSYTFAGERIPIEDSDIWERLDRELMVNSYYHSSTIQNIKLANRFFPVIEKILKKNHIPDDFKYLAVAESGLRNVVSPAGASGYWQFMKSVGKENGLEIYDEVDERYDIEKSTVAACKYLNKLKSKYGSWTSAAAAYNLGARKYSQALSREKENNYFNLNLNQETMRYLYRITALKEIISNPNDYGFYIDENEKYPPLKNYFTVKITKSITNLGDFAHQHGISYRTLKIYNPWLRSYKLTVKNNTYFIKIPRG